MPKHTRREPETGRAAEAPPAPRPLNLAALGEEETLFLRRLADLSDQCAAGYIPRFSSFLNERQQQIASAFWEQNHIENAMLFGGYGEAVRKQCGFFPVYDTPEEALFPIRALTLKTPRDKPLSHRDFLGTLMGLGLKRESVGDIIPVEGACTILLAESITGFVLQELKKVGNTGVTITEGFDSALIPRQEYRELSGTVSSPRLDSLVKLCTGLAREKAARLIQSGLVQLNYRVTESVSTAFAPGDTLTIRGYGKYTIDGIGAPTKKGRLPVSIRQYR
ncbi:YlmH/Sll1252 family protein [Ruminococcaceae bacterium OttesenSCG-928-L11]|nr:YlmH/Sll1252 family protein [Ruminococcaceae bacterium OttesenSCG-928-L11]